MDYYGNWGIGEWLAMSAMMLIFWGLVIAFVVWAFRGYGGRDRHAAGHTGRSDQLLAERFARGDIDEEEFTRRTEVLHASSGGRR